MARAYRGPYARPSGVAVPYATATVWGTGIDAIHSYYGEGPPLRTLGRQGTIGSSPVANDGGPYDREYQSPTDSAGLDPPEELTWGYPADDYSVASFGMGANTSPSNVAPAVFDDFDDRSDWSQDTSHNRARTHSSMTPWSRTGARLRAFKGGARIISNTFMQRPASQMPNETVNEGWLNKVTSFVADANPSDDAQIFIQTSMVQRYLAKDNGRAVMRGTDEPRSVVQSRVEAMVEKVYSGGERHYDMDPFQAEEIIRPFRFRTAGTGPSEWMEPNAFAPMAPYQRTPPADPSMGVPEVQSPESYGYTGEDVMFYG